MIKYNKVYFHLKYYKNVVKILGPNKPSAINRRIIEEYKADGTFHSGRKKFSLEVEILNGSITTSKALIKIQNDKIIYKSII